MNLLPILVVVALGLFTRAASAAEQCSIRPPQGASDTQLATLAKLSQSEAEKIAVAKVREKGTVKVTSVELEAERGCLLWSFDLRVAGRSGIEEVQVDAGNGSILSVKHESAGQEAKEKAAEHAAHPSK